MRHSSMKMKQSLLIVLCVLLTIFSKTWAQNTIIAVDSLPKDGFILTKNLDFHKGDNFKWKDSTNLKNSKIDSLKTFDKIGWFTLQFTIDSAFSELPLSFVLSGEGAFQVYLNGQDIYTDSSVVELNDEIIPFNFTKQQIQTLAIRYFNSELEHPPHLSLAIKPSFLAQTDKVNNDNLVGFFLISLFIFFLTIGFVHFMIFLFYRTDISNLYFFVFCFLISILLCSYYFSGASNNVKIIHFAEIVIDLTLSFIMLSLICLMYQLFYTKFLKLFYLFFGISIISYLLTLFNYEYSGQIELGLLILISVEVLRVVIVAIKQNKKGSKIIGAGVILFIFLIILVISLLLIELSNQKSIYFRSENGGVLIIFIILLLLLSVISIPLCMAIYLAKTFSDTNKNLKQKLIEVENLSAKNLLQEQEKKKILESQKEKLEVQVAERTVELAEKNKDITDSIKYAKRIQEAMLPNLDSMLKHLPDSFVLYKPKDIISGDFYWFAKNLLFLAAADCTGHGVPGALMSMIGSTLLNEIINGKGIIKADDILFQLREGIIKSLKQTGADGESKDGMDISLCIINKANQSLEFAGANNPLWIIRNIETIETESESKLIEIKGNKQPIGIYFGEAKPFTAHTIKYNTGDVIYLFTDGYADQFGGPKGKKFKYSQLQQLILNNSSAPMRQQKENLENTIKSWKGELEQIDDILVIGIKL